MPFWGFRCLSLLRNKLLTKTHQCMVVSGRDCSVCSFCPDFLPIVVGSWVVAKGSCRVQPSLKTCILNVCIVDLAPERSSSSSFPGHTALVTPCRRQRMSQSPSPEQSHCDVLSGSCSLTPPHPKHQRPFS